MDTNALLGVRTTFERVAAAVERDGIDAHSLERVMAWGPVVFGRQLTRRDGGIAEPFVTVKVTSWKEYTVTNRDLNLPALLACVLRELAYMAKAEQHGFARDELDTAFEIAADRTHYSERLQRRALVTLEAAMRHSRDTTERQTARTYVTDLKANLGDQT